MPISFDMSTEEIVKTLIPLYESKLYNMLTLDGKSISTLISNIRKNCRYLHVDVQPYKMSQAVPGIDLVFDLKYNVPIIEAKITSPNESVLTYSFNTRNKIIREGRSNEFTQFDHDNKLYFIDVIHLNDNELFETVFVRDYYNPEMIKTYKRYIELRGE